MTGSDIHSIILSRIAGGIYRPGDRLPTVRALAAELGVNRNTASKVYQDLNREGVARSHRGRGAFVAEIPRGELKAEARVDQLLRSALTFASLTGMSRQRLKHLIERQLQHLEKRRVRVAFVECNQYEAREIAERMQQPLGHPVDPFVLDELPRRTKLLRGYPIVSTTLYHLAEVQEKMAGQNRRIIGLQHSPSTESILEIARLQRGTRIAVIATNTRTLNVLLKFTEIYHSTVVGGSLAGEVDQVQRLAALADVLIVHPLAKRSIPSSLAVPVITVTFQIEPQSLDYLRQHITRLARAYRETG